MSAFNESRFVLYVFYVNVIPIIIKGNVQILIWALVHLNSMIFHWVITIRNYYKFVLKFNGLFFFVYEVYYFVCNTIFLTLLNYYVYIPTWLNSYLILSIRISIYILICLYFVLFIFLSIRTFQLKKKKKSLI